MRVNFPDVVWGRLATIADQRNMSITDLIVETAEDLLGAPRRARKKLRTIDTDMLAALHARGLSDRRIALAMEASEGGVRYRRKQMGLPPVGKAGRPRKTNPKEGSA